jgi:hypothetical protein
MSAAPYTIPAGSSDPVDQLYLYALTTYSARTGTPISNIIGDEWRQLDAGGSAVLLGMVGQFDLDPSSADAVMARAVRPLGAAVPYVTTQPRVGLARRGALKVRFDTLISFYPELGRDAGIARFMGLAASRDIEAETAQASSQRDQLRADTRRAAAQADRVSTFQAGDLTAALDGAGAIFGRAAGQIVGFTARLAGTGAAAFVGALPPAVIVAGAVAVVGVGVYAVRRLTA